MKLYASPLIGVLIALAVIGGYLGNKMIGVQSMANQIHGYISLAAILAFLVMVLLILNFVKKKRSDRKKLEP